MARSSARIAFVAVAWLFVACIVAQLFLAGLGVFRAAADFATHRDFGYAFGWLTLVLLVLALAARAPRVQVGLSVILLVQFALQSVFIALRRDSPELAALHPLNGAIMLAVALVLARSAWRAYRAADGTGGIAT
ncbi:MAG TPA: DUF6220 domain-containing protein [Candidatus Limnocylindrales bacterium]|nr:DUF6220 domain-containing protein [Candidatus Limnocylindrales bacterium]